VKVWGVNETQLGLIADEVGVTLYNRRKDGRALRFSLRPPGEKIEGDYKYQRTSASGFHDERRVHAVCWHGHRDYMLAIFKREPEARIKTMWADYRGMDNFMDKYPQTAYQNVGSMMYPRRAYEICNCASGKWMIDLSIHPNVSQYNIQQTSIKGCPHYIMVPEHYRPNGTCKCDDPVEQARMIAEWDYSPSDFASVS
jgi:hypothetical protein